MPKDIEEQPTEDPVFEAEHGGARGRTVPPSGTPEAGGSGGENPRPALPPLAIVVSRYNDAITGNMLRAAVEEYHARGGRDENLSVIDAFGAFELTPLAVACARSGLYAGVLCLGCVIKGETDHDAYIAHAVAQGLANIAVRHGVPCSFGVLTVNTVEQAVHRAGGRDGTEPGNKGAEAMAALIETVRAQAAIQEAVRTGTPRCRYRIEGAEDPTPTPIPTPIPAPEPVKGPLTPSRSRAPAQA